MDNWIEKMVENNDLTNIKKQRNKPFDFQAVQFPLLEGYLSMGWSIEKELKTRVRIKKEKPIDEQFEDRVWMLFAKMGFVSMNKDRNLEIPYTKESPEITKQIDILAIDEDTAIVIECKAAQSIDKKTSFKKEIEAIAGYKQGITTAIRKKYPKRKFAYIFATYNYVLGEQDIQRLKELDISYFDEDSIHYYEELTKQLGKVAKYQLLGHLFINKKFDSIEYIVPAVKGNMGGHQYYAFSAKPAILLKMCHVLHRDKINK